MEVGNSNAAYASGEKAVQLVEWYLEAELVDAWTADRAADLCEDSPFEALRLILRDRGRIGGRLRN